MGKIYNLQRTKAYRTKLRNNLTPAEKMLWFYIRSNQLGVKFRRQHGIGPYIADFYCPVLNLVIEIDGDSHYDENGIQHDKARTQYFSNNRIEVIRFTNHQVRENLIAVLDRIDFYIKSKLDH